MTTRICFVIPTLVKGGAEKQLSLLATHIDRDRFDVHVIVLTHSGPYEELLLQHNVPVHFIGKRFKFDPGAYRRLVKKLNELKPDIVHTWLFAANAYGRRAAAKCGVKVIVGGERSVDPWKNRWQLAIDQQLAKITDTIVTNTSAVVDFYSTKGIPAELFTVIPNAAPSPSEDAISREEFFMRLGIPPRGRVVGAVGRLWKQKGYPDLIWAAELLRVAYQDVWFVIVGDGPELKQLQYLRDKYGAKDAVKFVGERDDARQILSAFDVLWNGSLYEGQSNTILEAMSVSVPVVASDIPGNRDLVVSGETGYLFKLGDVEALTRKTKMLLHDDEKRHEFGVRGNQRVQSEFSLERMIQSHERLYLQLLEDNRRL